MGTLPGDGSGEGRIGTPPQRLRHGYRRCISPGLSALATDLGPLVTHPQSAGHRRCGGHRRGARGRPRRRPHTGDTGHGVPGRRRVAAGDHHGRGTGCAGAGFTSRRDRRPDAGQPRHRVDAPPRGAAALQRRVRRGCPQQRRRFGSGPAVHRRRATTTRSSPSASCAARRGPSSRGTGFRKFPWCRRIHPTGRPACRDAASGRSISVALDPIGGQTSADLLSRCTDR